MSEDERSAPDEPVAAESLGRSTSAPARLRRRPFGIKRADVDAALDARDTELAELRQDVAALWLAFAQHDRMIRSALATLDPPPEREVAQTAATGGRSDELADDGDGELSPPAISADPDSDAAIGRQLSDLDDVLVAIELATKTLERTYANEIAGSEDTEPERDDRTDEPAAASDPEGSAEQLPEDAERG